jgi:ribosomal protein S18 acetylase RimI-like enzyme
MYASRVPDVRLATAGDGPRLAEALADAFVDDPLSKWLFAEDDGLRDRLRRSFRALLDRVYLKKGHTYTTADLAGAAMWAPPGKWRLSLIQQLRLAPLMLRIIPAANLRNGARLNVLVERAHPADPHWHLGVLGVSPTRQRTGIGAALLRPVLERADADHVLCHLETSKEENIPYYARHGFEVNTELEMPEGAPRLWTMTRRPL